MKKFFILGPGRSGTTLMRSLLDSHPQLVVYPLEVSSFFEVCLSSCQYLPQGKLKQLNDLLRYHLGVDDFGGIISSGLGMPTIDLRKVNKDTFCKVLAEKDNEKIDINKYFERIFSALKESLSLNSQYAGGVMDVTSENIGAYLQYFSDVKLIFMIRHPISCYSSYKKLYYQNVDFIAQAHFPAYMPARFFDTIKNSFSYLSDFKDDPRIHVVKLEDLQNDPRNVMKKVAQFLDISFDPILLIPTILGNPYAGNTLLSPQSVRNPVSIRPMEFSDQYVTHQEKYLIEQVIPSQRYYSMTYTKVSRQPMGFNKFLKNYNRWWSTSARFPRNIIKILYGLVRYSIAYKSYCNFIENYYRKYHLN